MSENPTVFVSYSHDSRKHEQWVLELSTKLRNNGVDVILDQWDLSPGDDLTRFMEVGIRDFDRVIVICTDNYVKKANDREGGVGYEVQIVSAQLVENLGIDKFIPIIRQASGKKKLPTCLGARVYIDFTDERQFDKKLNELLHKLYEVPILEKPSLGKSPFAGLPSRQETSPSEGPNIQLPDIPEQVESAFDTYSLAVKMARLGDEVGFRLLLQQVQPRVWERLAQWRTDKLDGQRPNHNGLFEVVDKAVGFVSPLFSVAFAGIKCGREQFRDQKPLFDRLRNIVGWNPHGNKVWVEIPDALGYVYHSLHGSLCVCTNQLDLALSLARVKVPLPDGANYLFLWQNSEFMGWSNSLGHRCTEGWKYLSTAHTRWDWLTLIFGNELEYRSSLVAYYMALSIHELAAEIACGRQNELTTRSEKHFSVPLTFISEGKDVNDRAISLLLDDSKALTQLWTCVDVTRKDMEQSWDDWIRLSEAWFFQDPEFCFHGQIYHQHLFEKL